MNDAGGVILGTFGGRQLIDRSDGHVLVVGPTRCGKGMGVIVPTLLDGWYGSSLIHDPKGELWRLTALRRSRYGHCLLFDPTDAASVHFNPFDEIPPGESAVGDVQNAVAILTEGVDAGHWTLAAREYLVASWLHLSYAAPDGDKNLGGLRRHVSSGDAGCQAMIKAGAHPVAVRVAEQMMSVGGGKAEREESKSGYRGSVYNSAGVLLALYDDPVIDALTARSEFTLADLMCAEHPVNLYLVVRPSDATRIRRLITFMIVQARRSLMKFEEVSSRGQVKNHRLLVCLDEFLDFQIADMAEALRSMASYGMKGLLAAQSFADIEAQHGPGLANNCSTLVAYRPNSDKEAARISAMIGRARETIDHESRSYQPWALLFSHRSVSPREEERHVLPPDELMRWPLRQWSLVLGHGKPIRADIIQGYSQRPWRAMIGPPPSTRDAEGRYQDLPGAFASPWLGKINVLGSGGQKPAKPPVSDGLEGQKAPVDSRGGNGAAACEKPPRKPRTPSAAKTRPVPDIPKPEGEAKPPPRLAI